MSAALKAAYSVSELGEMAGMSRHQISRLIAANKIPVSRLGNKRFVYLPVLQQQLPDLWNAILARAVTIDGEPL